MTSPFKGHPLGWTHEQLAAGPQTPDEIIAERDRRIAELEADRRLLINGIMGAELDPVDLQACSAEVLELLRKAPPALVKGRAFATGMLEGLNGFLEKLGAQGSQGAPPRAHDQPPIHPHRGRARRRGR